MNRTQHLQWCKDRANKELDAGKLHEAFASFISDMSKHEETADHSALGLMTQLYFGGLLDNIPQLRNFINGFN